MRLIEQEEKMILLELSGTIQELCQTIDAKPDARSFSYDLMGVSNNMRAVIDTLNWIITNQQSMAQMAKDDE